MESLLSRLRSKYDGIFIIYIITPGILVYLFENIINSIRPILFRSILSCAPFLELQYAASDTCMRNSGE